MSLKRQDGRNLLQMRNIEFKLAIDLSVDGSCLYKQGLTEVICLVQGPRAKTQSELLLIEYSVSPFSNIESKRSSKFDKDYSMFAENLKESFENLIILDENGKSEISISVCVIQNDGSSKSAVFNAITLALLDAGVSMKDFLVSVTVGLDQGNLIVDLTQEESKSAQGELTISYQSRKQKIDFYELKTLKLQQQEMDQLSKLAVSKADEIYNQIHIQITISVDERRNLLNQTKINRLMKISIPSLTPEIRQRLEEQGFQPFKYRQLPDYANPHTLSYWLTNAGLGALCLIGRHYASQQQSIRILWSTAAIAIPLYAIATNAKLDGLRQNNFYRKTLVDRLELHPLTRRAWERAKETNQGYQNQLREQIATLEAELRK